MRGAAAALAMLVVVAGCSSEPSGPRPTTIPPGAASVTLPPPDAYPVIDAEDAADADLAPGIYRVRQPDQATWPPQCLDEMIVYATAGATTPAPATTGTTTPPPALDPNWEELALARQDRIRQLQEPICRAYWDGER